MAKAISNIKRVKIQGDITLTLTPEEAVYLKALVGSTVELDGNLDTVFDGYKTAEKHSVGIWDALDSAGVPDTGGDIFEDDELQVADNSLKIITAAVEKF